MERVWIDTAESWTVFVVVFAILLGCSYFGYWQGSRLKFPTPLGNRRYLPDVIPSTALALLFLILGFSFSMTVGRFEKRRQLVIDEANAIGTAYLRAETLHPPEGPRIGELLKVYLDRRIEFYEVLPNLARRHEVGAQVALLQEQIWTEIIQLTQRDRTAIESTYLNLLNSMFDIEKARTFALTKPLPPMIYFYILFVSGIGLAALSFVRGQHKEAGQWQTIILVLIITLTFNVIVDLDRPIKGQIQISQDAMISLRDAMNR